MRDYKCDHRDCHALEGLHDHADDRSGTNLVILHSFHLFMFVIMIFPWFLVVDCGWGSQFDEAACPFL